MTEQIQKNKDNSSWLLFVDRMMDTVDIVVNQVTSGRWILTVIAGVCLIHFTWSAKNVEEADKIISIFKDIVIFYFVVRDQKTNGGNNVSSDKTVSSTIVSESSISKV